ncbi:MFS transporter [Micromonospora sp. NPDC052213]|uniref:MFS transporter n=1 Tax=Micromonospora sp. NPDC052213 TaxID=3155812 RepID=UPI0034450746
MSRRLAQGGVDGTSDVAGRGWSPWRVVVGFGVVSLAADMVYEGARSVYGPLLASLGASAVAVGLVTGAGEAAALLLRLVSGPLADRTRRYWSLTILGYALTALCVPLLAVTPLLGGAGMAVAAALIVAERLGKAIRSPAKSALLADAAARVGLGRGLGVHKALDQVGAFAGPLLVAGVVALAAGALWPGLAALAVPGAVTMLLLVVVRARVAAPAAAEAPQGDAVPRPPARPAGRVSLPARFHWFAAAMALCTAGLVTFGLIGFHLVRAGVVATAAVPLLYAAAMGAGALAALVTGLVYDRAGPWVLVVLPALIAAVPVLTFGGGPLLAAAGVLVWGAAVGVQDSTVKALVADLVPAARRATAYGVFAAVQGAGALAGGAAAGGLYEHSAASLVVAVAVSQAAAATALVGILARIRTARRG